MTRVLVTFGSKRGGTAEIAARIADDLRRRGVAVDCVRAAEVRDVRPYDAVILGGALYAGRWAREAVRFARRHRAELRQRGVWLFSSGPLDDTASSKGPTSQVARIAAVLGARDHATFGGRLAPDAQGFVAHAMAKTRAGDWRNWSQIDAWTARVADAMATVRVSTVREPRAWLLALACLFVGLTAVAGGAAFVAAPDGHVLGASAAMLAASPFRSFLIPGLLLLCVVGGTNLLGAVLQLRRSRRADLFTVVAGLGLVIWTVTEIAMLRTFEVLQLVYLLLGLVITARAACAAFPFNRVSCAISALGARRATPAAWHASST